MDAISIRNTGNRTGAPHIQNNGVTDNSQTNLPNTPTECLVVGRFERGRFYKPIAITKGNVSARLGANVGNRVYEAIVDMLDMGVSRVWVLRIPEGV